VKDWNSEDVDAVFAILLRTGITSMHFVKDGGKVVKGTVTEMKKLLILIFG